jgi:glycosyltransferase 2 family protein
MKLLLQLTITVILVAAIIWQLGGLHDVGQLLARIDPMYALLTLTIYTLDRGLMTYKWRLLLWSRGQHLPFLRGLRIYCAAMVWGMFLPTTVGADAIRAFSTCRSGLNGDEVVASIFIERMFGFVAALVIGLCSLFLLFLTGSLDAHFLPLWWLGSLVLLGGTLAFATSFSQTAFDYLHGRFLRRFSGTWIVRHLRQSHLAYLAYRHEKCSLTAFLGLTFVEQLEPILTSWLIARGLGIEVSLLFLVGAVPLVALISRIPVSISGLGVYDGAFMLVMSLVGLTAAESIAIPLAGRILQTASLLPWWLAHVVDYGELRPPSLAAKGG